jgi:hypothetical protein
MWVWAALWPSAPPPAHWMWHPDHNRLITACKVSRFESISWTFGSWPSNNRMQGSKLNICLRAYVEHSDHDRLITVCRVASSRAYVEKIFKLCFVQKFVSTLGKSLFMYFLKHSRRSKDIFFKHILHYEFLNNFLLHLSKL